MSDANAEKSSTHKSKKPLMILISSTSLIIIVAHKLLEKNNEALGTKVGKCNNQCRRDSHNTN